MLSSDTDDQAEFVFHQLAQFTGARYVFLTYDAECRATWAATHIDQRDYQCVPLLIPRSAEHSPSSRAAVGRSHTTSAIDVNHRSVAWG